MTHNYTGKNRDDTRLETHATLIGVGDLSGEASIAASSPCLVIHLTWHISTDVTVVDKGSSFHKAIELWVEEAR